jgi:hypothetical protein
MIEVIPAPDHVAAFRISGTLKAEDYDEMIPQIEEKLSQHEEIGVFVGMEGFEDMTGEAIRRDVKYGVDKLGELHRFGRAAIATDKQWIRAATEFAAVLFPQIEAKVFSTEEEDKALSWASGTEGSA